MKYMRWILAVSIVLVAFAVLPRDHGVTTKAYGATSLSSPGVASVSDGGPGVPQAPEDRFAWEEFASLVHPGAKGQEPEWVSWYNKCDAGLASDCPPPSDAPLTGNSHHLPAHQSAAELPHQLISDFNGLKSGRQEFIQKFSHAPQLDSVLFNPVAADSIRRSNLGRQGSLTLAIQQLDMQKLSGADRRLPAGTFAFGSEIVKLIWEIIPDNGNIALPLYDPGHPPVLADSLQLEEQNGWSTYYKIKSDDQSCPTVLLPYDSKQPTTVPIGCFYWFAIPAQATCPDFSADIRLVWCRASVNAKNFLVFLVGFHVMKLTPGSPDWIWSTYYWTRDTNETESGKSWNAPWNHFHQVTTTAIRENAGDHAICYNPYLEGHETNGLKANCLSCHSFAAYSPNANKVDDGITLGRKYPYPAATRSRDEQEYFRDAVQTSFVWSISTSQNNSTSQRKIGATFAAPISFRDMLRNEIQKQPQNH
ncbi:MAG TPA: hypothetical protein VG649_15295 [Candidatus Angelobacter sp.]|jgi:hypothetical protein|nr:hypothetical protein [Candidatus Angelobacter sp.]